MNGSNTDVLVIGGGAAGMMAAITAARSGASVRILEKNDRPCRKVYITGKGRCNVTNHCSVEDCLNNIPRNPKFLYGALQAFPPASVMEFFEELGCRLKTERGNRVFPVSDRSSDIIDALWRESRRLNIGFSPGAVTALLCRDGAVFGAETEHGPFFCRQVILATGGASYPRTGSNGDGYALAKHAGHSITPISGSLVPLEESEHLCGNMAGLELHNVGVALKNQDGKTVYTDFGELTFTDFGLTGPTVLSASAHMVEGVRYSLSLDLKPALSPEKLEARLLRDLKLRANESMDNLLGGLLPRKMISPVLHMAQIPPSRKANELTRECRHLLLQALKDFSIPLRGKRPVEEAIITTGGVNVREVSPKTMESRLVRGLYFAGEILDLDAYTGGFNLQIAWSTGYIAGKSAALNKQEEQL